MNVKKRIAKIEQSLAELEKRQQIEPEDPENLFNNAHLLLQRYNAKELEQFRDMLIDENI